MPTISAVAVLILYDEKKRMLLQLRTAYKPRWANYWGLFGGHLNDGEDVRVGLRREIYEELGYEVKNPLFIYTQNRPDKQKHVFVERYDASQSLKLDAKETQQVGWFTLSEALQLQIIPHDGEVLEMVEKYL